MHFYVLWNLDNDNNLGIQARKELGILSERKNEPKCVVTESLVKEDVQDEESEEGEEIFKMTRKENIVQQLQNPLPQWKGRHMNSLLNILKPEEQGALPFPSETKNNARI